MAEEKTHRTQEEITSELYHDAMMAMQTTKLPRERTTGMTLPEFMAYWEAKTLALIAELETVRAERDALRAAVGTALETLNDAKILIENGERTEDNWDYPEYTELRNRVLDRITWHNQDAALNTQPAPQAEWTPSVGQWVRVKSDATDAILRRGQTGKVFERYIGFVSVAFGGRDLISVPIEELEPGEWVSGTTD